VAVPVLLREELVTIFWRGEGVEQRIDGRIQGQHEDDQPSVDVTWTNEINGPNGIKAGQRPYRELFAYSVDSPEIS
jgi:hypothetical protein